MSDDVLYIWECVHCNSTWREWYKYGDDVSMFHVCLSGACGSNRPELSMMIVAREVPRGCVALWNEKRRK